MSKRNVISPAFEPFMSDSGPNDKRDAIVVFSGAKVEGVPQPGLLRGPRKRFSYVKERSARQQAFQAELVDGYRKASAKRLPKKLQLSASPVGSSALPLARVEVTRKTLPALAEQPGVVAVMPNQPIRLLEPKQVDYADLARQEAQTGVTWGLDLLGVRALWPITKGANVNVAVLDTGVHGDHPALGGRVKDFVVVDPLGRRISASPTFDGGQHGTHVCGTIAGGMTEYGVAIGVAPEANLLVGGVLVGNSTLLTLVEGLAWAVERGAHIVNMSLGFTYYEPLFTEVFRVLIEEFGVLPVVAIGNENHGNSSSPGNAHNALSVGAAEKHPRGKIGIAFFSSGVSLVFPGADPENVTKPDVVAPGAQVFSTIPPEKRPEGTFQYTYMAGTSMATPHVAGVAALLMAAKPSAPVQEVAAAIKDTAFHPAGEGLRPDNRWGYGFVRPAEALQALG
jgi:serine protease AprX